MTILSDGPRVPRKPVAVIAAILFTLVAVGHLVRLCCGWEVTVADRQIPLWLSGFGTVVPAVLAALLWRESRR